MSYIRLTKKAYFMTRLILYFATLVLGLFTANAQQITGRIVDAETNESIPFATVKIKGTDLISNNDGYFTLSSENDSDLMTVSFIGYTPQNISVNQLKSNNNIIKLVQGVYDIEGVYVSNIKPDPNEIMKLVNEKLSENYGDFDYKYRIFTRESTTFSPEILEVDIKKSSGYSKDELKKANENVKKFTNNLLKNSPQQFTDVLLDYYFTWKKNDENKKGGYSKAEVIKGIVLKDENRSTSFDDIEKSALELLTKHLDTTKFYRIKSGLIGSRDTISFSEEYNRQQTEKRRKKNNYKAPEHKNLSNIKGKIGFTQSKANLKHPDFSFINKPELYYYSYTGATYIDDQLVYVLEFKPKKSKAKHIGKIYISEEDFAVLKVDYTLADGKRMGGINLKLILGVKAFDNVHQGTLIFTQNPNSKKYYLLYSSQESGQYFYINRPLKLIEINKNRKERELLSFNVKVEGNTSEKTEYLNMGVQSVSEKDLDAIKEKEFEYQILKKYDPSIWKGYNIIEPLEEMKNFKTTE